MFNLYLGRAKILITIPFQFSEYGALVANKN